MADARLRAAERAAVSAPDDGQARNTLQVERSRIGLCPWCVTKISKLGLSSMRDAGSGCAVCWSCYLKRAVDTVRDLVLDTVSKRLNVDRDSMESAGWVVPSNIKDAVAHSVRGRWPAVSYGPAVVQTASDGRRQSVTALAHRDGKGMIAVGVGLSSRYVTILEIGELWPELRPKQRIHDGCYVVAHGRPVYEKNLRQRLRAWASIDPVLASSPEACRIKAPKAAWKQWVDEQREIMLAREEKGIGADMYRQRLIPAGQ